MRRRTRRRYVLALLAAAWLLGGPGARGRGAGAARAAGERSNATAGPAGAVAVVVNPDGPIRSLTRARLRDLFLGRRTRIDGVRVTLVEYAPLRERFYRVLLQRGASEVTQYWLRMVFNGDAATPPVLARDVDGVAAVIRAERGAIGFLPADAVPEGLRVVPVDGHAPGSPGDPLGPPSPH